MNSYANAYTEVYTILQDLNEEEYNKIPSEVINTIKNNRNIEYKCELEEGLELKEQKLLPETKAVLFNLFRDYLSTPVQKEKIIKMQSDERQKNEVKKQQKYDVDVFKNRKQDNNLKPQDKRENKLVEYKENIFKNILNKIKKFFSLH